MVQRRRPEPVAVRLLEPERNTDEDAQLQMLYRPVPQLEGIPDWKIKYEMFDSEKAQALLDRAEREASFRQRPTYVASINRWRAIYRTKRMVNYLPAGPICFDPDGVMLNGKNRMMALSGLKTEHEFGFMCVYGVPRWMFKYFDTNRPRTIKDVLYIGNRPMKPQTPSAIKAALRYEEFLFGLRPAIGWKHWNAVKDEHVDSDDFYSRRLELQDWYASAEKVYRLTRLLLPSIMVFRFYQSLAWPDGDEMITEFLDTLITKESVVNTNAAIQLRDWSRDVYYEKTLISAKREVHLMLLFRTFDQFARNTRIQSIQWAYGMPMAMPYHPGGHEAALANVKDALAEMDEAATV